MNHTKIVLRTLFYQFFILFIGMSIGFLINPQWFGHKSLIVNRSIRNIFYPIEYNDNVEMFLMDIGKSRLWVQLNDPANLTFYNSKMVGEEWFETDYSYTNKKKETIEGHYKTRIKWKPWEYYYENDGVLQ